MAWVLTGKLPAGAMSQDNYLKEARGEIGNLTIVGKTFSIPRNVVSHRKGLPQKLVTQIKDILINMAGSDEGKKALREFEETSIRRDYGGHRKTPSRDRKMGRDGARA
jgi:ABC-type phosphate/phosphonate transport system substrate-binding protein